MIIFHLFPVTCRNMATPTQYLVSSFSINNWPHWFRYCVTYKGRSSEGVRTITQSNVEFSKSDWQHAVIKYSRDQCEWIFKLKYITVLYDYYFQTLSGFSIWCFLKIFYLDKINIFEFWTGGQTKTVWFKGNLTLNNLTNQENDQQINP